MRKIFFPAIFILVVFAACVPRKNVQGNADLSSDRTVTVQFHPFWGGMASCELERKKGKDQLTFSYLEKKNGSDTTENAFVDISTMQADSIFSASEKINWTQTISDGNADPKAGMKIDFIYKKGKRVQNFHWERLNSVNDLPADVKNVLNLMNEKAPDNFKMF
ncbi:MAG: hypothetical protein HY064_08840 [Bacteroidetes bacterium]|nr:hypothetical protein [Bacteroidota bacterium]